MSLLGALTAQDQGMRNRLGRVSQNMAQKYQTDKADYHANNFLQKHDFTPESFRKYIGDNNLNMGDVQHISARIKAIREVGPQYGPVTTDKTGWRSQTHLSSGKAHGLGQVPKTETPYKIGTIKDFKEGDKYVQKKYTALGWVKTGVTAKRYKPGPTINIGQKAKQAAATAEATQGARYKAYLESSPKVKDDARKEASEQIGNWNWEVLPKTDKEAKEMTRETGEKVTSKEAETFKIMNNWYRSIGAKYAEVNGVKGWYEPDENGNPGKLIKEW